jgi:hypothetical protein
LAERRSSPEPRVLDDGLDDALDDGPEHETTGLHDERIARGAEGALSRAAEPVPEPEINDDFLDDEEQAELAAREDEISGEVPVAPEAVALDFASSDYEGADFDANVTMPLERDDEGDEGAEPSVVSLDGLSSLLELDRVDGPPPPPPPPLERANGTMPPPPPPASRNQSSSTSRVPPPPPRRPSRPSGADDD